MINIDDSLMIFYYQDLILFRINHPYEVKNVKHDTIGNVIEENLLNEGVRFSYFVYKKSDSFGYYYDSINTKNYKKYLVDSFLRTKISIDENMFDNTKETLFETRIYVNELFEKTIPEIKRDESYPDTCYYYYNERLNGINYSFSKKMDSIKNKKLYKVVFKFNPVRVDQQKYQVPERLFQFEIKEKSISNQKEIRGLFRNFIKQYTEGNK